jgi:hypothetical protein
MTRLPLPAVPGIVRRPDEGDYEFERRLVDGWMDWRYPRARDDVEEKQIVTNLLATIDELLRPARELLQRFGHVVLLRESYERLIGARDVPIAPTVTAHDDSVVLVGPTLGAYAVTDDVVLPAGSSNEIELSHAIREAHEALARSVHAEIAAGCCVRGEPTPAGGKTAGCLTHGEPWPCSHSGGTSA